MKISQSAFVFARGWICTGVGDSWAGGWILTETKLLDDRLDGVDNLRHEPHHRREDVRDVDVQKGVPGRGLDGHVEGVGETLQLGGELGDGGGPLGLGGVLGDGGDGGVCKKRCVRYIYIYIKRGPGDYGECEWKSVKMSMEDVLMEEV